MSNSSYQILKQVKQFHLIHLLFIFHFKCVSFFYLYICRFLIFCVRVTLSEMEQAENHVIFICLKRYFVELELEKDPVKSKYENCFLLIFIESVAM